MYSRLARLFESHFYILAGLSWLLGALQHIAVFLKYHAFYALDWKITQYYVSYWDYGSVKRGLVGTLLHPAMSFVEQSFLLSRLLIVSIDFLVFFIFVKLLHDRLKTVKDIGTQLFVRMLLILSPLGLSQWSFDVGRYDHLAMLLVFGACWLVSNSRFILGGLLLAVTVLCHEASAFYGFAIIFIIVLSLFNDKSFGEISFPLLKTLLPAAASFFAVVVWGNIEDTEQLRYLEVNYAGGWSVWQRGALEPALHLSIAQYFLNAIYFGLVAIAFYPMFSTLVSGPALLLALIPFILLYVAGIDYPRWSHLFFISCILLLLFAPGRDNSSALFLKASVQMRLIYLFLLLPLGPIGITTALPYIS